MLKQLLEMPTGLPRTNGSHRTAEVRQPEPEAEVEETPSTMTASEAQAAEPRPSRLRDTAIGLQILVTDLYDEVRNLMMKLDPFLVKGEAIRFDHEPAAGLKPHDTIHHEAEQVGHLLVALRALNSRIDA